MDIREQQQSVSVGLGLAVGVVALLPATASLDLKWVALALAAALLCLFKAVVLLSAAGEVQLLKRRRSFEWLIAALTAVLFFSAWHSPWPDAGWLEFESLLPALVLALFAHNLEPDARGRMMVAWLWMAAAAMVSLYALLQVAGVEFVAEYQKTEGFRRRAMAGFGNPTFLAGWLAAAWPFAILAWHRGRRGLALLVSLMVMAALIATQTRSGMAAVLVQAGAVAAALIWMRSPRRVRAARLGWILGLSAAFVVAALLLVDAQTWTRPTQRLELWSASLDLWLQRPWLGFGPGSFVPAMQEHLPAALRDSLQSSRQFAEHPHNWILSLLCDGGLLLAGVFLALVGLAYRGIYDVLALGRREKRPLIDAEIWTLVLGLSLTGLLVQNLFDRNLKLAGGAAVLWVLLGWLSPQDPPRTTRVVDVGTRRIAGAGLLLAAVLLAWSAVGPVLTYRELKAKGGFVGEKVEEASSKEKGIGQYLFQNPDDPAAWEQYGESLARQRKFNQAAQAYEQALKLRPNSMVAVMNLGNCYFMLNQWDKAKKQFEKAVDLDPRHADAHFNLGYVAYYQNKMKTALKHLNRALSLDPGHAAAKKLKQSILGR